MKGTLDWRNGFLEECGNPDRKMHGRRTCIREERMPRHLQVRQVIRVLRGCAAISILPV